MSFASEYAFQTLLYVSRMVSDGDYSTPEKMGISREQMLVIRELTTQDIHSLSALTQANFLSIAFDKNALSIALNIIVDKNLRQNEIYEMLKAGASYPVMKYIYGITTSDMAACRKVLNLPKSEGRPSLPSDVIQNQVWSIIKPDDIQETDKLSEKLLFVSRKIGVKINVIWTLLNHWSKDSEPLPVEVDIPKLSIIKSVM